MTSDSVRSRLNDLKVVIPDLRLVMKDLFAVFFQWEILKWEIFSTGTSAALNLLQCRSTVWKRLYSKNVDTVCFFFRNFLVAVRSWRYLLGQWDNKYQWSVIEKKCTNWWKQVCCRNVLPHTKESWFQVPRSGAATLNVVQGKNVKITPYLYAIAAYNAL